MRMGREGRVGYKIFLNCSSTAILHLLTNSSRTLIHATRVKMIKYSKWRMQSYLKPTLTRLT